MHRHPNEAASTVAAALQKFETEDAFTPHMTATDAAGRMVAASNPRAVRWNVQGALMVAAPTGSAYLTAIRAVSAQCIARGSALKTVENQGYEAVMDVLRRTHERLASAPS